ncbi:MAG: radical SAM protein, partial [Lachnospiraceae bacterium]|nr:radical SAM protein [Lachnospiraceae bacterium]
MDDSTKVIKDVRPNTAASEAGIIPGDRLVSVNGHVIHDIFDYQYECEDTNVEMTVLHADGSEETCLLIKTEDEDPGLVFEDGIMDEYRRCHNKCIFCFIDQMPKGMRDTLYFKDDDSRLSFLQGNYVTLTNMSDEDIDRVIRYNLEPINISFQTTNPKLRCMMMGNRHAGDALKKADRLYEAGIRMNGQIVLC